MRNPGSTVASGQYEFSTFSGVDIKAVFQGRTIGTLQQLAYRMSQQKMPVYTMGSKFARGLGYGTMLVSGTLVFTMIDKHELLFAMREVAKQDPSKRFQPWLDKEDAMPSAFAVASSLASPLQSDVNVNTLAGSGIRRNDLSTNEPGQTMSGVFVGEDELGNLTSDQVQMLPNYVTEIPPFTITLVGSNEMGRSSTMSIYGVSIITEGYQISIDNITSDLALEFIAFSVTPWIPVQRS